MRDSARAADSGALVLAEATDGESRVTYRGRTRQMEGQRNREWRSVGPPWIRYATACSGPPVAAMGNAGVHELHRTPLGLTPKVEGCVPFAACERQLRVRSICRRQIQSTRQACVTRFRNRAPEYGHSTPNAASYSPGRGCGTVASPQATGALRMTCRGIRTERGATIPVAD